MTSIAKGIYGVVGKDYIVQPWSTPERSDISLLHIMQDAPYNHEASENLEPIFALLYTIMNSFYRLATVLITSTDVVSGLNC